VRLANRLAPYRIGWFEEPVPPENADALRQFRELTGMPVCVGERLYTRWQFRPVLEQKLADYIMPDIIRTGGISEMKKIATMAEAFFIPVSPHDATGPITLIAGAQVMMTTPNFFRLEIAYSELPRYQEALTPPLDVRDATICARSTCARRSRFRRRWLDQVGASRVRRGDSSASRARPRPEASRMSG
jgi:galactonate dehydratase